MFFFVVGGGEVKRSGLSKEFSWRCKYGRTTFVYFLFPEILKCMGCKGG